MIDIKNIDSSRFISFEGIDYSGKSTQIDLLKKYLEDKDYEVYFMREPGGTEISEAIREILLDKKNHKMNSWAEIFLYSAARVQLVGEKIIPLLQAGHFVIADRFVDSTTAYQGFGRNIDPDVVKSINQAATFGLLPGITFYLELSPEESIKRSKQSGRQKDRLEASGIEFFQRVFNGYKQIAETNRERICIIDAARPIDEIHQIIISEINTRMGL